MQVEYAVILASDGTSWIFYQEILPVVIDKRRRVRLWWQFLRGNLSIQLNRHNSVNFLAAYAGVILIDSPFEVSIIQQERSVLLTSEALELHRYDKLYSFIVKKRCHDRLWAIGHVLRFINMYLLWANTFQEWLAGVNCSGSHRCWHRGDSFASCQPYSGKVAERTERIFRSCLDESES